MLCLSAVSEWEYGLCSIQALLSAPNPDDPLADNIAKAWKDDEAKAMQTGMPLPVFLLVILKLSLWQIILCVMAAAQEWTRMYATSH